MRNKTDSVLETESVLALVTFCSTVMDIQRRRAVLRAMTSFLSHWVFSLLPPRPHPVVISLCLLIGLSAGSNLESLAASPRLPTLTKNGIAYSVIRSAADLQAITDNLSGNYLLDADVDISNLSNFLPIGSTVADSNASPPPFTGILDGAGHKIMGLTQKSASRYLGLFGVIGGGGSVRNLTLTNGSLLSTYAGGAFSSGGLNPGMIGMLAGWNNGGIIEQVTVSGTLASTGSGNALGGLIGINAGSLSGVSSNVAITATITDTIQGTQGQTNQMGGLVGFNHGSVRNSRASGNVTGIFAGSSGKDSKYADQVAGLVANSIGPISGSS